MAKHFRAWARAGYTFGMDVDGTLASRILKKVTYETIETPFGSKTRIRCLEAAKVKTLMGPYNGWQIDERHFDRFEVEDSGQIYIRYEGGIYYQHTGKMCPVLDRKEA